MLFRDTDRSPASLEARLVDVVRSGLQVQAGFLYYLLDSGLRGPQAGLEQVGEALGAHVADDACLVEFCAVAG